MNLVTLFCGGGTADLHAPKGLQHLAAFDYWEPAVRTFNLNFGGARQADLSSIPSIPSSPDVLWTSPPCVDFSPGRGKAAKTGTGTLLGFMSEYLKAWEPSYCVVENHPRAFQSPLATPLLSTLQHMGYRTQLYTLNEHRLGGRGSRGRAFLVAKKTGGFLEAPERPPVLPSRFIDIDSIQGTPAFRSDKFRQVAKELQEKGGGIITYNGVLGIRPWTSPHTAVTTHLRHLYVGPHGARMATPEEYALVLGAEALKFPRDLTKTDKFRIIGNGVGGRSAEFIWSTLLS